MGTLTKGIQRLLEGLQDLKIETTWADNGGRTRC